MFWNTPDFPIVSWKYDIESPIAINLEIGTNQGSTSIPTGSYWGYSSRISTGSIASDSLHGILLQTIVDRLKLAPFSLANPVLSGSYIYDESGLEVNISVTKQGIGGKLDISFTSDSDAKLFGFANTSSFSLSNLTNNDVSTLNSTSYWAPYSRVIYDDRTTLSRNFIGESIYGDSYYSNIKWGTTKTNMIIQHPFIEATLIFGYRRDDSNFDMGELTSVDQFNRYDLLIEAAREDKELRLYFDNGEYYTGKIIDSATLQDLKNTLEDVSARGRLWKITTPYRLIGEGSNSEGGIFD